MPTNETADPTDREWRTQGVLTVTLTTHEHTTHTLAAEDTQLKVIHTPLTHRPGLGRCCNGAPQLLLRPGRPTQRHKGEVLLPTTVATAAAWPARRYCSSSRGQGVAAQPTAWTKHLARFTHVHTTQASAIAQPPPAVAGCRVWAHTYSMDKHPGPLHTCPHHPWASAAAAVAVAAADAGAWGHKPTAWTRPTWPTAASTAAAGWPGSSSRNSCRQQQLALVPLGRASEGRARAE